MILTRHWLCLPTTACEWGIPVMASAEFLAMLRRVEPAVARWLPHRPGRADFSHPVLPVEDSPENTGLRRPSPPVLATRCCLVDASRCSVSSWRFPSTVLPFSGCLPWLLRGSLRSRFATFPSLLRRHYDFSHPFASACFGGLRPLTAAASRGFARTTDRCSHCAPGRC